MSIARSFCICWCSWHSLSQNEWDTRLKLVSYSSSHKILSKLWAIQKTVSKLLSVEFFLRNNCKATLPTASSPPENVICKWCSLETAVPGRAANWSQHRFSLLLPCIEATRKAFMAVGICLFYDTISPCPLQRLAKHISDSDFYISHLDPGEAIQFMYCKHNSYQLYLSVTNLYGGQSASFSSICDLHPTLSSFFGHVFSPHYLFLCGPVSQQQ